MFIIYISLQYSYAIEKQQCQCFMYRCGFLRKPIIRHCVRIQLGMTRRHTVLRIHHKPFFKIRIGSRFFYQILQQSYQLRIQKQTQPKTKQIRLSVKQTITCIQNQSIKSIYTKNLKHTQCHRIYKLDILVVYEVEKRHMKPLEFSYAILIESLQRISYNLRLATPVIL